MIFCRFLPSCCCSSSSPFRPPEAPCSSCSASWCPLLPAHLSASNKDFITQLSQRLGSAARERTENEEEVGEQQEEVEEEEGRSSDSTEVQSGVEVGAHRYGTSVPLWLFLNSVCSYKQLNARARLCLRSSAVLAFHT